METPRLSTGICPAPPHSLHQRAAAVCLLLATLALAACETVPVATDGEANPALERMISAGDWATLSTANIRCAAPGEACAKAHAAKGDACLRLAIQLPPSASEKEARTRELLDCAEENYRNALLLQPTTAAPSRESFHGGLLLTLSERRNRLDALARDKKLDRENEKLMMAAQNARREAAGSALGYLYGASAHAYRAALMPTGRDRCNDLRQAEMLLGRSPSPPRELTDEQARITALVRAQLRSNGCPRIVRR